ncbi:MAG: single-stranded DNA-binding protein [Planctomycetaceae bacterium]|nr:single-stranded DNA-binding protein [Planctomycetaceae bacterium]
MASFNKVILMGNLTRDPELRHIPNGTAVTDVSIAVNDRRKTPNGEWVEEVTYVDVTLWGRTAEIACEFLSKSSPLLVEGRLKLDSWETDGQKRTKLKVIGEKLQLIGGSGRSSGESGTYRTQGGKSGYQQQSPQQDYYDMPPEDDVPF